MPGDKKNKSDYYDITSMFTVISGAVVVIVIVTMFFQFNFRCRNLNDLWRHNSAAIHCAAVR